MKTEQVRGEWPIFTYQLNGCAKTPNQKLLLGSIVIKYAAGWLCSPGSPFHKGGDSPRHDRAQRCRERGIGPSAGGQEHCCS
eukprot:scaffold631204_cov50-Prasinocladus_malaysianus.AAC.1